MADKRKGKGKARTDKKVVKKIKRKDPYSFDPVDKWTWTEYESNHKLDIDKFIEGHKNNLFFIGTDSQMHNKSRSCVFTTVLIAYEKGRGGAVARYTDKRALIPVEALSSRLTVETQRSIEICKHLETKLFDLSIADDIEKDEDYYTNNIVGITVDVNSDVQHWSGRYKDMLVGMVLAYGFKCFIKPDAWASSSVADKKC